MATTETPAELYSHSYRRYVLGLLFAASIFNLMDRQVFGILIEPIKQDLNLSDSALGFISGIAFAILYTTLGLVIGRYADRANRQRIISASIALWSAMTVVSGFAMNFTHLVLARVGVSIGQSGFSPAAHSLISDFFPLEKRATAMSIYGLGALIGVVLMFLVGGWAAELYGWRIAFIIIGLPGVVFSLVVFFTLKEPPRGYSEGRSDTSEMPPVSDVLRYLWSVKSFRYLSIGNGFMALVGYGTIQWISPFLIRSHNFTVGETGTALAGVMLFGAAGTLTGGVLSDKLGAKDRKWYLLLPAIGIGVSLPVYLLAYIAPLAWLTISLLSLGQFFSTISVAPSTAMVQALSPLRMRALASAVFLFVTNLVGLGVGPLIVGLISDAFVPSAGAESLRYALIITTLFLVLSTLYYWIASRTLKHDLEHAKDL